MAMVYMPMLVAAWAWLWHRSGVRLDIVAVAGVVLAPLLLVIPHECIHLLAHPGAGRHADSVVGISTKHGAVYAMYLGEMSRARFLAILLAPFVVLSLVPLAIAAVLGFNSLLALVSLWNGLLACGDLLGARLVLRGMPAGAITRNRGWYSYWRTA